jgi:hypothetical protein
MIRLEGLEELFAHTDVCQTYRLTPQASMLDSTLIASLSAHHASPQQAP